MKNFFITFTLFIFSGCSSNHENSIPSRTVNLENAIVAENPLPEKYFAENYKNSEIKVYKNKKKKKIYQELSTNSLDLNQLQRSDALNLIGTPILIKQEGMLELWQYKNKICVTSLIWERENEHIVNIIGYDTKLKAINPKDCILNIIKSRKKDVF